jgi:hypothetical protein
MKTKSILSIKHLAIKQVVALISFLISLPAMGQLSLIAVSIPDTVVLNEQIAIPFTVKNQGIEGRIGNLQLQFLNSSNDSIVAPLGGYENTLQFFAPQQTRDFTVNVDITPSFFIEGGNTVVIWPSMVANPEFPAEPIIINVYVLGSTGVQNSSPDWVRLVNPVSGDLHFIDSRANPIHGTAEIYAVSGQLIASQNVALGRAQLPNLADGVYGVLLRRTGEQSLFFRFVQLRP